MLEIDFISKLGRYYNLLNTMSETFFDSISHELNAIVFSYVDVNDLINILSEYEDKIDWNLFMTSRYGKYHFEDYSTDDINDTYKINLRYIRDAYNLFKIETSDNIKKVNININIKQLAISFLDIEWSYYHDLIKHKNKENSDIYIDFYQIRENYENCNTYSIIDYYKHIAIKKVRRKKELYGGLREVTNLYKNSNLNLYMCIANLFWFNDIDKDVVDEIHDIIILLDNVEFYKFINDLVSDKDYSYINDLKTASLYNCFNIANYIVENKFITQCYMEYKMIYKLYAFTEVHNEITRIILKHHPIVYKHILEHCYKSKQDIFYFSKDYNPLIVISEMIKVDSADELKELLAMKCNKKLNKLGFIRLIIKNNWNSVKDILIEIYKEYIARPELSDFPYGTEEQEIYMTFFKLHVHAEYDNNFKIYDNIYAGRDLYATETSDVDPVNNTTYRIFA